MANMTTRHSPHKTRAKGSRRLATKLRGTGTRQSQRSPICGPSGPCHLLRLPAKIRLRILSKLLTQSEPLHQLVVGEDCREREKRNYRFTPAILRACRQLHAEGTFLLYNNTFDIVIYRANSHSPQDWLLNQWHPTLLAKVRHFNVTVLGSPSPYVWPLSIRNAIHHFCAIMTETVDLSKTTMAINMKYAYYCCYKDCRPFTFLRHLVKVKVTGVPEQCARYIEGQMTRQEPAENIWKMEEVFLDWCHCWTGKRHSETSVKAVDSIYSCGIESFKRERVSAKSISSQEHATDIQI